LELGAKDSRTQVREDVIGFGNQIDVIGNPEVQVNVFTWGPAISAGWWEVCGHVLIFGVIARD
jgi:hypothetical protein